MSVHTSGPLTIKGPSKGLGPNDDGGDYAIIDKEGKIIAEVIHLMGRGNDTRPAKMNALLFAAAPETKAQLDQVLIILKQAIPFVIAWANDHSGPAGDANRIGMRLASRMQIAIDNARGDGL